MILTSNYWIISKKEMKIAFGECEMFPCGYVSCKLTKEVIDWALKKELKHPDNIDKIGYIHNHTHNGGMMNKALLNMNTQLINDRY